MVLEKGQWLGMPNQHDAGPLANCVLISVGHAGRHDKHETLDAYGELGSSECDEDFQNMRKACNNGNSLRSMYLWWTRYQVSDWEALKIVSTFGATPVEHVKIDVLAEKRPHHLGIQMEPWEAVVLNLAARVPQTSAAQPLTGTDSPSIAMSRIGKHIKPFDGQAIVALLKAKIDTEYALLGQRCHPIVLAFKSSMHPNGESCSYVPSCYTRMHCEAVLASTMECRANDVDGKTGMLQRDDCKVM